VLVEVANAGVIIVSIITLVMVLDRLSSAWLSLSMACSVEINSCVMEDLLLGLCFCAVWSTAIRKGWMATGMIVVVEGLGIVIGRFVNEGAVFSCVVVIVGHLETSSLSMSCQHCRISCCTSRRWAVRGS